MKDTEFAQLIGNKFQIWQFANWGQDQYQMELRHLRIIPCTFEPQYEIKFPIYPFNSKVKYYMRVIDNAVNSYINAFSELKKDEDRDIIAFQLKKNNDRIFTGIKKYYQCLNIYQDVIDELQSDKPSFTENRIIKESVTLSYYMLWSIVYCQMEIQHLMSIYIVSDDMMTVEDLFTQNLGKMPPKDSDVVKREDSRPREEESLEQKLLRESEPVQHFYEVMEPVGFFRLDKTKELSANAKIALVRKLVEPNGIPFMVAMVKKLDFPSYFFNLITKIEKNLLYEKLRSAIKATTIDTISKNFSSFDNENYQIKYSAWNRTKEVDDFYKELTAMK